MNKWIDVYFVVGKLMQSNPNVFFSVSQNERGNFQIWGGVAPEKLKMPINVHITNDCCISTKGAPGGIYSVWRYRWRKDNIEFTHP